MWGVAEAQERGGVEWLMICADRWSPPRGARNERRAAAACLLDLRTSPCDSLIDYRTGVQEGLT